MCVRAVSDDGVWGSFDRSRVTLPWDLDKMGVRLETWEVDPVDLTGVDLKHPTDELIEQLLGRDSLSVLQVNQHRGERGSVEVMHLAPSDPRPNHVTPLSKGSHIHPYPEFIVVVEGEAKYSIWGERSELHEIFVRPGQFFYLPQEIEHTCELTEGETFTAIRVNRNPDERTL